MSRFFLSPVNATITSVSVCNDYVRSSPGENKNTGIAGTKKGRPGCFFVKSNEDGV